MENQFEIKIIRQHWVKDDGKDDATDLCSHGEVYLKIGSEEVSNSDSGSWTLSTTALYLMRTLDEDYKPDQYNSQLIPCCGHFFMADTSDDESVIVIGCPIGIDWTINHLEDGQVKHIAESGEEGVIDSTTYQKMVLRFVNDVEQFYAESQPKVVPDDEFHRKGYQAFWSEWKRLKGKIYI